MFVDYLSANIRVEILSRDIYLSCSFGCVSKLPLPPSQSYWVQPFPSNCMDFTGFHGCEMLDCFGDEIFVYCGHNGIFNSRYG